MCFINSQGIHLMDRMGEPRPLSDSSLVNRLTLSTDPCNWRLQSGGNKLFFDVSPAMECEAYSVLQTSEPHHSPITVHAETTQ